MLTDAGLTTVGQVGSHWSITDQEATIEPRSQGTGLTLETAKDQKQPAAVTQHVDLRAGLYELLADARGQGQIRLSVGDYARDMPLSATQGLYGLLLSWPGGMAECRVAVTGRAELKRLELNPVSSEQQAGWQRELQDLATFGYITVSAQRPLPGQPAIAVEDIIPLAAMTDRVVFYDERMPQGHVVHIERLVHWLTAHGFVQLNSDNLAAWMRQHVEGGAYGSVVVMPMGVIPQSINMKPGREALWFQYLATGGRVVWAGDPPFYRTVSTFTEPPAHSVPSLDTLGLTWGWNIDFWGDGTLPVTLTEQGKAWGLERCGGAVAGYDVHQVSIPLSVYTTRTGRRGAASWMLNFKADMPWSGVVAYALGFDGQDDASLRDIWRAAHYVGHPVTDIPPLSQISPPAQPMLKLAASASDIPGRTQFARGETISLTVKPGQAGPFEQVQVRLTQNDQVVHAVDVRSGADGHAAVDIGTSPFAYGDYLLRVEAYRQGKSIAFADLTTGIRAVPPLNFGWEVWMGLNPPAYQIQLHLADIVRAGMGLYLTGEVPDMDAALRCGRPFSLRVHADGLGPGIAVDNHPERFIRNGDCSFRLFGTHPQFSISHPESLTVARQQMIDGTRIPARHPAFNGAMFTNDDYSSLHYGFDYSEHNLARFKLMTGHDAPVEQPKRQPGIVPDDDPWVQWNLFTLREVSGGWNQMQKEAVTSLRPDIRIGPIPGGMQIPLINMVQAGQYPPLNFGAWGHNLISFYYYDTYWQPLTTNTCWLECGRMNNREMPTWVTPDLLSPIVSYTRNSLFHLLAGGVRGLTYYHYDERTRAAWAEINRLKPMIERISPVQVKIKPKNRRIALLHSVTSDMFDTYNWLLLPYAYANLIQAHYDVDIICEEEVLSGICKDYDAVLLYRTLYLRQSVADALTKQAAQGAHIYADHSVPLNIPGVQRIAVDLGMGQLASQDVPPEGPHIATPGPTDYGHPDRIQTVAEALLSHVKPMILCDDPRLVAHPFQYGAVQYVWFVNALSGEEYRYCQKQIMQLRTSEATMEAVEWDRKLLGREPMYTATLRYPGIVGVPYDLTQGRPLTMDSQNNLTLTMDRLGGSLVAFYPEPITKLTLDLPATVEAMKPVNITVTVRGNKEPIPGVVPVRVELVNPEGNASPLSQVMGTEDGVCILSWTPAINDLRGNWRVTATELASGQTANATMKLP
ncbi:MAG: hypothetical protein IT440_11635 [Phycisphaeraceae bacterium]|nr:hypothetical protein [Phycisphaeraceae bacterium]